MNQNTCQKIIDTLNDGLYFVDRNRIITFWSKAAERISGFSAQEVVGKCCADNILTHVDCDGQSLCLGKCPLAATITDSKTRESKLFMHHKDGHRVAVAVKTNTLTDDNGVVIGGIELFTDITNQIATEERIKELQQLALMDNLTHLANRHYITKEITSRFQEKKRFNISFGILFMDVDNFKTFNDTYGHEVGDSILKVIAKTLTSIGRPYDLFGRWGGEEFIGVIHNIDRQNLATMASRTRRLVETSYVMHKKQRLNATISIGATLAQDDDTMKSIINRADQALFQSKAEGKNRVTLV